MPPFEHLRIKLAQLIAGNQSSPYDNRQNSPFISSWSHPPKRSTAEWLETYGRSPRLGVVTKIAEDLSFIPGRLIHQNLDGEDEDLPENHPFWTFWNRPNPLPQFTQEAIWQLFQVYLLLVGEAYMVIEKDWFGFPAELWPLPPHWVTATPTAGNPYYTVRTASGLMAQIHVNDMFVQMELNPIDPYGRGLGQAQGIADEVEIDEYASAFEKRFFYNDATPSSIIAIEGADADAVKRFEADWNNKFRGVSNSHRSAVTSGKVSAVKLADNMKDLDMVNGRQFLRDTTLEHFHMPREIMGITENSNRSTAEAAQYIYAQNVLTPMKNKRESAVNIQLVPYWGDDVRYQYNEIIPRNQEFDKMVAMEGWTAGVLMRNEARKKIDMEPTENGDVFQAPLLFGYVSATQDLTSVSTGAQAGGVADYYDTVYMEEDPESGNKEIKASISHVDQQAVRQLGRAQHDQARQAENAATQYFSRTRRSVLEALRGAAIAGKSEANNGSSFAELQMQLEGITAPIARAEVVIGFVEKMTDWTQDEEQIRELLTNMWSKTYERGQGIMQTLYNLKNPYQPQSRDIFKRMGGKQIAKDISGTTKSKIVEIIDSGLAEGADVDELARRIGASSELGPYRAKLIAKQETANSISAANYDSMKEGGVRRHKWMASTIGHEPRPSHRKLNGQVRNIGERFANGLRYPRDREGPAEEVVNCECWTVPLRERDPPPIFD